MIKKIKFYPKTKETEKLVEVPEPSKNFVPDWYKKIPPFENNKIKINEKGIANKTVKMCVPFSDSFNMGYIQKTWCDIYIENIDGNIKYFYSSYPQIIEHREKTHFPIPQEYYPIEFAWKINWIPQLPDGYSIIYTHPFNRIDLPFHSLTGVVDSDKFKYELDGSHPFFIKNTFSGIIPAGTPFLQMIPIKRESWQMETLMHNEDDAIQGAYPLKNFWGWYKKNCWNKKVFR